MLIDSPFRHPGESRDPFIHKKILKRLLFESVETWVPAFAGMTEI